MARTKTLNMRMSEEEISHLKKLAEKNGLSLPNLILKLAKYNKKVKL